MSANEMDIPGYAVVQMNNELKKQELLVEKIIYAKRKKCTGEQVKEILVLEINNHLRNHPHLEFIKGGIVLKTLI